MLKGKEIFLHKMVVTVVPHLIVKFPKNTLLFINLFTKFFSSDYFITDTWCGAENSKVLKIDLFHVFNELIEIEISIKHFFTKISMIIIYDKG